MEKESTERALLMSYQRELQILGYVKNTIFAKMRVLINFKTFIGKTYQNITEKDLYFFSIHLHNKALHSNTMQHYFYSLQQFFLYLERVQIIDNNPFNSYQLELKKQSKKAREILSQEEIKQLYRAAKKGTETLLLHLCYGCGLRAKELENINTEDIVLDRQFLKVVEGKNNQHRILPMPPKMHKDMVNYLQRRSQKHPAEKAVLLNKKGKRLRAYTARKILQKILARTTIEKVITLHCLRHSIATHLLENGMKVEYVQQFLGHKQLETTENYTRISKEQLKNLR